jgi:Mg-chelatase subunit ChlD
MCASLLLSFSLLAGQKDVIMVLDTSLSMVGQGSSGNNIMKAVKKDIKDFIYNDIKDGDRLTFLTFDSKVEEYPTFKIDDENDRNIATKFLLRIEPKGLWTHTKLMIETVIKKAKELEKTGKDRQPVIIILTDALDDPPPGKKGIVYL